jgi:hypothetical protein
MAAGAGDAELGAPMSDAPEYVGVRYEVVGIERCKGSGNLVAIAIVRVHVHDLEFTFQGLQVRQERDGKFAVRSPHFRHPRTGVWFPSVLAPLDLQNAIADELCAMMSEQAA